MKENGISNIVYTSGSGVYGNLGEGAPEEDYGPLMPVSLYGATKLSAEALISAYCNLFDMTANVFRFANVVGPYQTHGVSFDFVNRLKADSSHLRVLGDGYQSKSYVHVSDVIKAILHCLALGNSTKNFDVYNVSSGDYLTVREIAEIAIGKLHLKGIPIKYGESNIGWPGDVPVVRFDDRKLRKSGWTNEFSSQEAISDAIDFQIKYHEK